MRAAFIEEIGPPENLQIGELPDPVLGDSQVLVRVRASAINPIDTYIRSGAVKMALPFPFVPGCDFAGEVQQVGANVHRFKIGDRVWGSNQGLLGRQGTLAEKIAVDQEWVYPTPENVCDEHVAAIALVGITAHLGLLREARLSDGEVIFVNGGSGGVGNAVIQIAKTLGAKVITTAGSDNRVAECRAAGADWAINYKTQDVTEAIKQFAPHGVNVYWETQREPDFDVIVERLAPRGRIVLMAGRDARPPFPVGPFYVKGCSMHGFAMFNALAAEQALCAKDLMRWMAEGKLKAKVDRTFALADAGAAHRLQEENTLRKAGTLCGKIVVLTEG